MQALNYGWKPEDGSFFVSFDPCTREPLSFKEELLLAAKAIVNEAGDRPIWLCFGGGTDSEAMCNIFFEQGIHFSVLTIEHAAKTNRYDMLFVKKWCYEHNIPHEVYVLDMNVFLSKDITAYIEDGYAAGNIVRYIQIKLLEIVHAKGGYAVLGGGDYLYEVDTHVTTATQSDVYLPYTAGYVASLEWCRRNNTLHTPFFYYSSPELCVAYQREPVIAFALEHPESLKNHSNSYLFNRIAMQTLFPSLKWRHRYAAYIGIQRQKRDAEKRMNDIFADKLKQYNLGLMDLQKQLGR